MINTRCLAAVAARRPMDTNIFDLRRAEQSGHVKCSQVGPAAQWSLTPEGEKALAEGSEGEL